MIPSHFQQQRLGATLSTNDPTISGLNLLLEKFCLTFTTMILSNVFWETLSGNAKNFYKFPDTHNLSNLHLEHGSEGVPAE